MARWNPPTESCLGVWREYSRRLREPGQKKFLMWAYHNTPQSTTGETPFSLVYGSNAMIPIEIQESSPRFQSFVAEESNEERTVNLDLLDEVREEARIKAETVKRRVKHKYSSKLKPRQFQVKAPTVPSCWPGNAEGSPIPVGEQVVPQVDWPL